jgi:hypothetical protein
MAKVKVIKSYALVYKDGIARVGAVIDLPDSVAENLQAAGIVEILDKAVNPEAKMEKKAKKKGKKRGDK